MLHEVLADKLTRGDWRVEAINHAGEGECFVTIFSGPDAQARAEEYAGWKNFSNPMPTGTPPRSCPACGKSTIEYVQGLRHEDGSELCKDANPLKSVQEAARIIAEARDKSGPPVQPPSMLWSALSSMWDHLDELHKAIESGEYDEHKGPFEPKAKENKVSQ